MGESNPMRTLVREIALAAGMITILVLAMWAHTGSMPPLVVVESNSMQHDIEGEIGTIDAGDLVLVHSPDSNQIITFAEAPQLYLSKTACWAFSPLSFMFSMKFFTWIKFTPSLTKVSTPVFLNQLSELSI